MDKEAKHILIGFAVLGILWFMSGGYNRQIAKEGVYLEPAAPLDSGRAYGGEYQTLKPIDRTDIVLPKNAIDVVKIEESIERLLAEARKSDAQRDATVKNKKIVIDGSGRAEESDPSEEFIRIIANPKNLGAVEVTGMTLESGISGESAKISGAAKVFVSGAIPEFSSVMLMPGDRAIITSGRSPLGVSFQTNMCTGFLDQFQDFAPPLRQDCPDPEAELEISGLGKDASCREFVENLPRCEVYRGEVPAELSASCKAFIRETLTYNGCVANHARDEEFLKDEWRIFLGRTKELWRDRLEIIKLLDSKRETVDSITY